jgi:hypothetical protein
MTATSFSTWRQNSIYSNPGVGEKELEEKVKGGRSRLCGFDERMRKLRPFWEKNPIIHLTELPLPYHAQVTV